MLDKLNRVNLLYDIYRPLLTERQQQVLKLYFSDDLSMGEIAAEYRISRQAVYDLIRRALAALEELEKKLGLLDHFAYQQERLLAADQILQKPVLEAEDRRRLQQVILELRQKNEQ